MLIDEIGIDITPKYYDPWINMYTRGQYQEIHDHHGVDFASVFFANDGEGFAKFYFHNRHNIDMSARNQKIFKTDVIETANLTKPRLSPDALSMVPNSMEATVELALANNRDLLKSKMDVEIARNDLNVALAGFGPTVDGELKYSDKADASHTAGSHHEEQLKVTVEFPISGFYMERQGYLNDRSALDRAINDLAVKERDTVKVAKDAWVEYSNARTMLSYSENEATIAQELLTIAQKERAADQTDAAAVLSAEETLESSLKDLSDDSMSLVTSVYEILDVINSLEPSMIENTKVEGTFNTPSS